MANYPLSHITVGGNTYDIEHATILTCTIDQADFSGGAYLADAWLKGAADDLNVLSSSGKTLTDAYDDLVAGHPVYLAIEVNSSITDIIPLSVDAGGWQKIFYGVVSTTGHIYSFKVFDATMMDDFPTKISKTADSASGGGGGGGFTPLHINKNGSLANLYSLAQSDTVEILDSTNTSLDINNIATYLSQGSILKMAQVGSPSPKTYTDIIHIDIVNKTLTLIFSNSVTQYIMVLNNTWNVNWNVQLLQRLMTQ